MSAVGDNWAICQLGVTPIVTPSRNLGKVVGGRGMWVGAGSEVEGRRWVREGLAAQGWAFVAGGEATRQQKVPQLGGFGRRLAIDLLDLD